MFVAIEHHSRRLIHYNVSAHPSAQWTRQQLRVAIGYERRYEYSIHDRDSIFPAELDEAIQYLWPRAHGIGAGRSRSSPEPGGAARSVCVKSILGGLHHE